MVTVNNTKQTYQFANLSGTPGALTGTVTVPFTVNPGNKKLMLLWVFSGDISVDNSHISSATFSGQNFITQAPAPLYNYGFTGHKIVNPPVGAGTVTINFLYPGSSGGNINIVIACFDNVDQVNHFVEHANWGGTSGSNTTTSNIKDRATYGLPTLNRGFRPVTVGLAVSSQMTAVDHNGDHGQAAFLPGGTGLVVWNTQVSSGSVTTAPNNSGIAQCGSFTGATYHGSYLGVMDQLNSWGSEKIGITGQATPCTPSPIWQLLVPLANATNVNEMFIQEALPEATAITQPATIITNNKATLNGLVNGNGYATNTYIEYGTAPGVYSATTPALPTGSVSANYNQVVTGLIPNTTYYFRVVADNGNGVSYGNELSFATLNTPAVHTTSATSVNPTGATLNGYANNSNNAGNVFFEYGTVPGTYTNTTANQVSNASATNQNFNQILSGLILGQTYYYRARMVITGDSTIYAGVEMSFTPATLPTATTKPESLITNNSAQLNGEVSAGGIPAIYSFEYGTTPAFGSSTPPVAITGATLQNVFFNISGLSQNTTYYYRIKATNANGTQYGLMESFITWGLPTGNTLPTVGGWSTVNIAGFADINDISATAHLEYTQTSGIGYIPMPTVNLSSNQNISNTLLGLNYSTTYYYRIVITNSYGTFASPEASFTTNAMPAIPLSATVTSNGNPTQIGATVCFDFDVTGGTGQGVIYNGQTNNQICEIITQEGRITKTFTICDNDKCITKTITVQSVKPYKQRLRRLNSEPKRQSYNTLNI